MPAFPVLFLFFLLVFFFLIGAEEEEEFFFLLLSLALACTIFSSSVRGLDGKEGSEEVEGGRGRSWEDTVRDEVRLDVDVELEGEERESLAMSFSSFLCFPFLFGFLFALDWAEGPLEAMTLGVWPWGAVSSPNPKPN